MCVSCTNSNNLIKNCFSEFVERQSFMLRYLSKTAVYKLKFSKNLFEKVASKGVETFKILQYFVGY